MSGETQSICYGICTCVSISDILPSCPGAMPSGIFWQHAAISKKDTKYESWTFCRRPPISNTNNLAKRHDGKD